MKPLLVMAHRGEARAFLSNDELKSLELMPGQLYEGHEYYLLLCGEGRLEALHNTTLALSQIKVSKVINLGVCGSLSDHYKKDEIVTPSMVLFHDSHSIEFKSFNVNDREKLYLITTNSRVLKDSDRNYLSNFGAIVDREAWAIAYACDKMKIPFETHKIVSDIVGESEICQRVKETSEHFSRLLYQHFQTLDQEHNENLEESLELPNGFHFSLSQKRKFHSLMCVLENYEDIIQEVTENFSHLRDKEKTRILLEKMSDRTNPFMANIKNQLYELSKDFQNEKFKLNFDQNFESSTLWLNARIDDENDLASFKRRLTELPYSKINQILDGEI